MSRCFLKNILFHFLLRLRLWFFHSSYPGTPTPVPGPSDEAAVATASANDDSPNVPNPGPKPLTEGAPAQVTSAEPNEAVPVASQTVSSKDFGRFIGAEMTDDQKMTALTDRWCPSGKE